MSTACLSGALTASVAPVVVTNDHQIRACVRVLMSHSLPPVRTHERRRDHRIAFPYPIHLVPLGDDGRPHSATPIIVFGKHLSERGLDFYHREPLPYRRMIASFACGSERWIGLVLALSWCRFNRFGFYDNGGRFLQVTNSPLNKQPVAPENIFGGNGRGRSA